MKQNEIDILVKTLQGLAEPEQPLPPPPPIEPVKHSYVTLNGVEPELPVDRDLKKKLIFGLALSLIVGAVFYFLVFHH